jgi:hypothetical protein
MLNSLTTLEQESGISQKTLTTIRKLHQVMTISDNLLPKKQLAEIQDMLEDLIGNMSMNQKFDNLLPFPSSETGIDTLILCEMKDLSYRTRYLHKMSVEPDTIWKNFQTAIDENKILAEHEKITLQQYGILHDLAILNQTLEAYDRKKLIQGNARLEKLYSQTQSAAKIINYLKITYDKTINLPTGAVIFDDTCKKAKVYGKTLTFFEWLIAFFITKFGHASKGIFVTTKHDKKENTVSHINPTYGQEQFTLRNYLYSEIYCIKIENLIDDDGKELLATHLGQNWRELLQQQFAEIERRIHDKNRSGHIHVITDGSLKRYTQIATTPLQGGHSNFFTKDHRNDDVRDDIFGKGRWQVEGKRAASRLICSEFIGKTIIASVQELNDHIKQQLGAKGVRNLPETLIKNPISEQERLHLLTPERLLKAMQARGAVEKFIMPDELSHFVNNKP